MIASHEGFTRDTKSKNRYYSPFRDEKTTSFVVYPDSNRWVDYGRGDGHRGGDGINLIQELKGIGFKEAVDYIQAMFGKDALPPPPAPAHEGATFHAGGRHRMDMVVEIQSRSLIGYLESRRIPVEVARKYYKEVHYTYSRNGRKYYAIGFANDPGGWVVRTAPYAGEPNGKKMDILARRHHDDP